MRTAAALICPSIYVAAALVGVAIVAHELRELLR